MSYIAVKDLKRPRELRETLEREREVIVTKDGRPFALMLGVEAEDADETLREVRRALFSSAVLRARRRAREHTLSLAEVDAEIKDARKSRNT